MGPPEEEIRRLVSDPFGAEIRYPGDRPETLPGDEVRACQLAQKVRSAIMAVLDPYLSEDRPPVAD